MRRDRTYEAWETLRESGGGDTMTTYLATSVEGPGAESVTLPYCSPEHRKAARATPGAGFAARDDDRYEFAETCAYCGETIPASA